MRLYRQAPEGDLVGGFEEDDLRILRSDPWTVPPSEWEWGPEVPREELRPLAPLRPRQIVGIGRSYLEHAAELGNPVPEEPLLFLKAVSSVIGPRAPILLPPESGQVDFEGEIALVIGRRITRPGLAEATEAIFGVTAACDVTARDLQHKDRTFARAKSFDTFCPLGPAIRLGNDLSGVEVTTRVNGIERQRGRIEELAWSPSELVRSVATVMTLEPGDVVLTGTPAGVGPLAPGDRVEVEVTGVGVLDNPVEARVP